MSPLDILGSVLIGFIILAAGVSLLKYGTAAQGIISSLGTAYTNALSTAKS